MISLQLREDYQVRKPTNPTFGGFKYQGWDPAVLISTKVIFTRTFSLPFISHSMMENSQHFDLSPGRTPANEVSRLA
jgi:hypothetical protein